MNENLRYSMLIQWSDEDQAYLVLLPEWADRVHGPVTHGDTYEEAVKNGQDAIEALVASAHKHHESLPLPRTFAGV
jgi:antitoxin HicB